jgi:hypothetical protein
MPWLCARVWQTESSKFGVLGALRWARVGFGISSPFLLFFALKEQEIDDKSQSNSR